MRLTTRYTLYHLIGSAVPIGLVVLVLFLFSHEELEKTRYTDLQSAADLLKANFLMEEQELLARVSAASDDLEWTRLVLRKDEKGRRDQLAIIEKATRLRDMAGLSYVEVLLQDSLLLGRSGDYSSFDVSVKPRPGIDSTETVGIALLDAGSGESLYIAAAMPVRYMGDIIAHLQGGRVIDKGFLNNLERLTGASLALTFDDETYSLMGDDYLEAQKSKRTNRPTVTEPLTALGTSVQARLTVLLPPSDIEKFLRKSLYLYALVALAGIAVSSLIGYMSARHLTVPVRELATAAENISKGEFEHRIIWFASDELGTLVDGFNTMYDRLKRSQEKLVQSEKVAAWNQMARKVAHEIKNPLTPIQLSVEDMKRSFDAQSEEFPTILDDGVETIKNEVARLRRLTDEFSKFARLPAPEFSTRDIRPVIADALRIYSDKVKSGNLGMTFPQEPVIAEFDADLLSQALVNLVKNGFESAGPDGRVEVFLEKGKHILKVRVEDDGPGVPEEVTKKLFTPHFTTKKDGTGLGLVIAYRIAFDHGGRIRYEPRSPKGACFVIVLPLAESKP